MIGEIYCLKDPITDVVRYIGQTRRSAKIRYHQHIYQWRRCKRLSHVNNWIKALHISGLKPKMEVIESNIDVSLLNEKEIYYIALYKKRGFNLTNLTPGGTAYSSFDRSYDYNEKRLQSLRVSPLWAERNKRHSEIITKKHKDPNCKIGFKWLSPETVQKMRIKAIKSTQKAIYSLDIAGNILKKFDSIKEAAQFYKIKDSTHIVRVCKGKSKSGITHGLGFKYAELDVVGNS